MSVDDSKTLAKRVREGFISTGDARVADEVLAEDFVYHGPAIMPEVRGRAAFKESIAGFRMAMPNMKETIEEQFVDGDRVISRFRTSGTHTGSMGDAPPTGNTVESWGLDIIRLEGGKVAEMWAMIDTLNFAIQTGIVAAPGE
jgi:predicted ester cyclase